MAKRNTLRLDNADRAELYYERAALRPAKKPTKKDRDLSALLDRLAKETEARLGNAPSGYFLP